MSDTRLVAHDNKHGRQSMSDVAVQEARQWLEALTVARHRGPRDTWTAARDRTAKEIGLEPSYAARIWHRWDSMKDVSGGAYRRLSLAYTALCERNERAAAEYRARREEIENGPTDEERGPKAMGMAKVAARSSSEAL